jgi:hypothetical protein
MTSEALALFDAAQASAPNAGARKRNRPEDDGAAPDFAAMLAQLQPASMAHLHRGEGNWDTEVVV